MFQSIWMLGIALVVQVPSPLAAEDLTTALRADRQSIREQETGKLRNLSDRFTREGQPELAKEATAAIEPAPRPNGPARFVPLAEVTPAAAPGHGLANIPAQPSSGAKGRPEIALIRDQSAKALFDLASRAANAGRFAIADDCLRAVLARDPNHLEARRLLGFVLYEGGWATPYAVEQLKSGHVQHRVFGWVPSDWAPHLDRGELPSFAEGRSFQWIPAAQADAQRNSIQRPWRIGTEHFAISTDVPLSETISFGRRLEQFHALFFSLMADLVEPDLPLAHRFRANGKAIKETPRTHQVFYFANKQQYVDYLQPTQGPSIAETLGFCLTPEEAKRLKKRGPDSRPASFFYKDDDADIDSIATLYHEVSHQLLFESTAAKFDNASNYWIMEGLGTYFETVKPQADGSILVGGAIGPRIALVKLRLFQEGRIMPIEHLVGMDKGRFRGKRADVYENYQMATALVVFLMHYDGGRYREAFLDYAEDVYRGRLVGRLGRTLQDRLGVPFATLDQQLVSFLRTASSDDEAQ